MNKETVGEPATLFTADHPPRSDSPTYRATRTWLMDKALGGCIICGGESDLSHPGDVESAAGLQDHHGGGLYVVVNDKPVLVGINLFPVEWSEGWGADPAVLAQKVSALNQLLQKLGQATFDMPITADTVMEYADSTFNANIKLCAAHHIGLEEKDSCDANAHQAVGIHNIPFPIWIYQSFCDWAHWDMWAGTTGTIAVVPDKETGGGRVVHVSHAAEPDDADNLAENNRLVHAWYHGQRDIRLPATHNLVVAAKAADTRPAA